MNKKLLRSRNSKVIGGVCGGLGNYFNVDAVIFRFAFVALLLAGGGGFIIYIILLVIMPKEPLLVFNQAEPQPIDTSFDQFQQQDLASNETDSGSKTLFGLLLISGGALLLLHNLVPMFRLTKLWPAILIITGLGLLFQKKKTEEINK